jgi:hypothetical protein
MLMRVIEAAYPALAELALTNSANLSQSNAKGSTPMAR